MVLIVDRPSLCGYCIPVTGIPLDKITPPYTRCGDCPTKGAGIETSAPVWWRSPREIRLGGRETL
jgi:hypothetical protein